MCKSILFFYINVICISQTVESLPNNTSIENYFANKDVNQIKQDKFGYIWIATANGLFKFDGYQIIKFTHANSAISEHKINNFLIGSDDNIWIATNILSSLNLKNNKITNYNFKFKNEYFGVNDLSEIIEDEKSLWISSRYGLLEFDKETTKTKQYLFSKQMKDFAESNFEAIIKVDDLLLLGGGLGLKIFNIKTRKYDQNLYRLDTNKKINNKIYCLFDNSSSIWVGTRIGLKQFDLNKKIFIPTSIKNEMVTDIQRKNDNLIVSTETGLTIYNPKLDMEQSIEIDRAKSTIKGAFEDNSEILWLNLAAGGLITHNSYRGRIQSYTDEELDVNFFYEDNFKQLWIGAHSGVFQFDSAKNELSDKFILRNFIKTSLYNPINRIYNLVQDKYDNYWVATGSGLFKFSSKYQFIRSFKQGNYSNNISSNYVFSITNDDNYLWLSTYRGLDRINLITDEVKNINLSSSFKTWHILDIKSDTNWLWLLQVSTLFRINKSTFSIDSIENKVRDFRLTDYLLIRTDQGIDKYIKRSLKLENRYIVKEKYADKIKGAFLTDKAVWFADTEGISKYIINSKTIKKYGVYEGITNGKFSYDAIYKTHNNYLFFGKTNGFQFLHLDDFNEPDRQATIYLTNLKAGGESQLIFNNYNYILPFEKNDLSLAFSTLEFSEPKRTIYKYRIKNTEKSDWNYLGYSNKIEFANLYAGDYNLEISATNNSGVWLDENLEINISILPPFWQTLWFKLVLLCLVIIIVYSIYRMRINKLIEIDRVKQRISSDLHDDLGTSLTKISMFSQLISSIKTDNSSYVDQIRRISNESIEALDDIVWTIDPRNDSMDELIIRIENFLSEAFNHLHIKYQFKKNISNIDKILTANKRKHIYLIVKEAINNSIKHSDATSVDIDLHQSGDKFNLKISDNGIGIALDEKKKLEMD